MQDLTPEQTRELRASLLALQGKLKGVLEASNAGARPVDLDQPIGRVSRMDAIQQQSMVQASRRASQRRLQQVEAALRRLSKDDYGECLECGEAIAFARLEVQPETPFCVACQGRREASR